MKHGFERKPVGKASGQFWRVAAIILGIPLYAGVLLQLYDFSQNEGAQHYSHFVLIPVIAGFFVFVRRRDICEDSRRQDANPDASVRSRATDSVLGPRLIGLSIVIYGLVVWRGSNLSLNDQLALMTTSMVLYITGAFLGLLGADAFRAARFPILFLVFIIPIPEFLLERLVVALQWASTSVVDLLFRATGTVYLRNGFFFSLPGLNIEVAQQCSGIRSSLALFIFNILAGHMGLRTFWGKVALALAVFPITVFKNGVRIVLLSLLAIHWDQSIMQGGLHKAGGIPFFLGAMALLGLVLFVIRRAEDRVFSWSKPKLSSMVDIEAASAPSANSHE